MRQATNKKTSPLKLYVWDDTRDFGPYTSPGVLFDMATSVKQARKLILAEVDSDPSVPLGTRDDILEMLMLHHPTVHRAPMAGYVLATDGG